MDKEQYLSSIRGYWNQTFSTHIGMHPNPNFIKPMDFIPQEQLNSCKLFSNRHAMIFSLCKKGYDRVAEVGVQEGIFNEFINETLQPKELYAIDIDITQYTNRTTIKDNVIAINKPSQSIVELDFSGQLDLLYLDADHSYEAVKEDIKVLKNLIKPGGYFIFNDFTMFSVHEMMFYGVARAVTEFLIEDGWQVIGLALDEWNFYDIALKKPTNFP